jgi:hypothetical protein
MLGTNDSKPQNWDAYSQEFVSDYCDFIDSFASLPSQPMIWICRPVPVFRTLAGITNEVIRNEIDPLIEEVAQLKNVRWIDLYTPMLDTADYFADGVHPDKTGAGLMAEILMLLILDIPRIPEFNNDGVIDLADYALAAQFYSDDPGMAAFDPGGLNRVNPDHGRITALDDLAGLSRLWLKMPGLVARWSMEELAGEVATDYVLNPASGPFTVVLWAQGGQPGEVLISQDAGKVWLGTDATTGTLMTSLTDNGGRRTRPPLISDYVLDDDLWHKVALVWDDSFRYLFVDDVEVAADYAPLSSLASARGGLLIGAGPTLDPASAWSGLIDDVRLYDRALFVGK